MVRTCRWVVVAVVASSLVGCTSTPPFRDDAGRIVASSVASEEQVSIGGIPQTVWFRGRDATAPALVVLHGGPGISETALFRHYVPELERHFLVVYWDQRGAGRSFDPDIPVASMTIGQLVEDLDEVIEVVRRRFGKDRVALLGHSWGSALGVLYAHAHPEKVSIYAGTGQIADMPAGELASWRFAVAAARARLDDAALDELLAIGPPPHDVDENLASRRYVERFGGAFRADLSTGALILAALDTDEAGLWDVVRFGRGNRFSLDAMWPELRELDLSERCPALGVPVIFLLGRFDWQVPSVVAARYLERLDAPWKQVVWFEGSAHHPPFEEPRRFVEVMVEDVLPWAARGASARGR